MFAGRADSSCNCPYILFEEFLEEQMALQQVLLMAAVPALVFCFEYLP